ncbi:hypothetical protein Pmani_035359 [Petrolisthes manimaculis]|uniref:Uncharacterized protein n=1 Tax=Petrolisthes manimaculis TaxID=1843537 RepID=A0AAE1NLY0_9EUCA|nr:hypothetical protein Pmani_035359 [Petrolisthes manimaculis]
MTLNYFWGSLLSHHTHFTPTKPTSHPPNPLPTHFPPTKPTYHPPHPLPSLDLGIPWVHFPSLSQSARNVVDPD